MQNISYRELINQEELQLLQNELCRVAGVYACCLSDKGEYVTELSSTGSGVYEGLSRDEVQTLRESPYAQRALERVEPDSLEDTAVEAFPGGRVAALSIRVEGRTLLYWLLFDCSNREEGKFAQVLDLVRDASTTLYRYKLLWLEADVKNKSMLSTQKEKGKGLQRSDATTAIVQLLDSDEQIEIVMERWLQILGQYLQAESAEIFRVNSDARTMELLAQWCNKGISSSFGKHGSLDACTLFQTDKPLAFSTGSIPGEHRWEAEYYGWSAIMVFPIMQRKRGTGMMLAVSYWESSHNWETGEVKFTGDAVKMLQSILNRRIML